jgi:hypothetical protein
MFHEQTILEMSLNLNKPKLKVERKYTIRQVAAGQYLMVEDTYVECEQKNKGNNLERHLNWVLKHHK